MQFPLPQTGEGIAECELVRWFVKEGDAIEQFEPLCEVQSDKATISITSRYDGVVEKLHWSVGDVIAVGANMVDIRLGGSAEDPDDAMRVGAPADSSAPAPAAAAGATSTVEEDIPPVRTATVSGGAVGALATPAVRAIAREHGINLGAVAGSGKSGRVVKEDILAFLNGTDARFAPAVRGAAPATAAPAVAPPAASDVVMPVRGYGRAMVKAMDAANAVPHFLFCDELRMDALRDVRHALVGAGALEGAKLTYLPLLIKALSVALTEHPRLNATANADCSEVTLRADHNVGVAMATPNGLVVPNIKAVQAKSVAGVARELARLQQLAKDNKLGENDLKDGTITVSNVGTIGGTYASPLLNLPEVAIVALGRVAPTPRYGASGELERHSIMPISWSADHRAVDGATMARMSARWKELVERPTELLLSLK